MSAKKKTGPKPDAVKLRGDWKDLMKSALAKKKPAEGWPDAPNSRPKKKAKGA